MINAKYGKPKKLKGIEQSLFLTFRYKQNIVDAIRKITPRYWHNEDKMWELDYSALSELKELLPREEFMIQGIPVSSKRYGEKIVNKDFTLPKLLKTVPYEYQVDTFYEGMAFDKYIYNLDQGTGKSLCALMTVAKRMELGQVGKCLILPCLNSLKFVWKAQIEEHLSGVKCKILGYRQNSKGVWSTRGTKEKLEDLQNIEDDIQFYITNIESIREKTITDRLVKLLDKGIFNCIIVDECHLCKAPSASQSKALMRLENHVKYSLLLTGTILMNKPDDLYMPLKITNAFTGNYSNFKMRYNVYGGWGNYAIVGHKHLDELQSKLMSVSKRVKKEDVLTQLPPKVYIDEIVEMNSKQSKIYADVLNAILTDIDTVRLSIVPLAKLTRLRQASIDTSLLSTTVCESAKYERALDIIKEIIERNESVIVFSCWEKVITNFRKLLTENHLISAVITGKIKDREEQFRKFNEDVNCHIILGSIGAMGVGFTLTKASNILFIDEPWTMASKLQAEDRAHRISQDKTVYVYTLMSANTIDQHIHSTILKKQALGQALVDDMFDLKDKDFLNYLLTGEGGDDYS